MKSPRRILSARSKRFAEGTWNARIPRMKKLAPIHLDGNRARFLAAAFAGGSASMIFLPFNNATHRIFFAMMAANMTRVLYRNNVKKKHAESVAIKALYQYSRSRPDFQAFLLKYPKLFILPDGIVVGAKKIPSHLHLFGMVLDSHNVWTGISDYGKTRKQFRKRRIRAMEKDTAKKRTSGS